MYVWDQQGIFHTRYYIHYKYSQQQKIAMYGVACCLVLCEIPRPHNMGKDGTISVSELFLLVHYNNVARAEFPSRSDQKAIQKCVVSVAG